MPTNAKTKAKQATERKTQPPQPRQVRKSDAISAVDFLETQHREVEGYFDEFEELEDNKTKGELAQKICTALTVHMQIEEEIFYPQARKATKDEDLLDEAVVEHAGAKNLISEIKKMKPGDDLYDAKIKVLGEMIKHHVEEEEEELFPECEKSGMDVQAVGAQLAKRNDELMKKMVAA